MLCLNRGNNGGDHGGRQFGGLGPVAAIGFLLAFPSEQAKGCDGCGAGTEVGWIKVIPGIGWRKRISNRTEQMRWVSCLSGAVKAKLLSLLRGPLTGVPLIQSIRNCISDIYL